jgi:fused signal recognition particle receptor
MRLLRRIASVLKRGTKVDESLFSELEVMLIEADVGVRATHKILDWVKQTSMERKFDNSSQIAEVLRESLIATLQTDGVVQLNPGLHVILVVGVNGTGKTTSIAKLANYYLSEGRKVMLACCDTYRAAAGEQLALWADRLNVYAVIGQNGADSASVAFDAVDAATARGTDLLLIDTAGRQHTRAPLMQQLEKIRRVLDKRLEGAPHQVLLVLDATTGQNAISQAEAFTSQIGVTGIMLTKLDGTAKGGIVIAIADRFKIPICWIGLGEGLQHLEKFNPTQFVNHIFGVRS